MTAQALEYERLNSNLLKNIPSIWTDHKRIMVTSDKPPRTSEMAKKWQNGGEAYSVPDV